MLTADNKTRAHAQFRRAWCIIRDHSLTPLRHRTRHIQAPGPHPCSRGHARTRPFDCCRTPRKGVESWLADRISPADCTAGISGQSLSTAPPTSQTISAAPLGGFSPFGERLDGEGGVCDARWLSCGTRNHGGVLLGEPPPLELTGDDGRAARDESRAVASGGACVEARIFSAEGRGWRHDFAVFSACLHPTGAPSPPPAPPP